MPSSPDLGELVTSAAASAWTAILDDFERQLGRVDLLTAELTEAGIGLPLGDLAAAAAPAGDAGPLPAELRERAAAVLVAQREAMARLETLRAELARHLELTRALAPAPDVAVYLDSTA